MSECRLTDALDHIMRVARQSDRMTKRLKWIELRAKSAIENTEEWREYDYPKNRGPDRQKLRRENAILRKNLIGAHMAGGCTRDEAEEYAGMDLYPDLDDN